MILKFALPQGGWKFIDKIEDVTTKYPSINEYNNSELGYKGFNEAFLFWHKINEKDGDISLKEIEEKNTVSVVLVYFWREKQYFSYLLDTMAYLLNDEGKTIERINN